MVPRIIGYNENNPYQDTFYPPKLQFLDILNLPDHFMVSKQLETLPEDFPGPKDSKNISYMGVKSRKRNCPHDPPI